VKISKKRMDVLRSMLQAGVVDFYNLPKRERNWLYDERLIEWTLRSPACHTVRLSALGVIEYESNSK